MASVDLVMKILPVCVSFVFADGTEAGACKMFVLLVRQSSYSATYLRADYIRI